MTLTIRSGSRLAIAAAVVALATGGEGIASARTGLSVPSPGVRLTPSVLVTTKLPGVPALVSKRGPKPGPQVTAPASLKLIYGYRSDVAAGQLTWVDWGQPVAFATGDILIQTAMGQFQSVPGALVLTGLIACGTKPTYYYKTATAYTPTYPKYTSIATGKPQLASPC